MTHANGDERQVVLIYVDAVPPPRMPFVITQAAALKNVDPYFAGIRAYPGGREVPSDRIIAVNERDGLIGKVRELPFRRFGCAPFFRRRLRRLRPVLLHAHSGFAGVTALGLANWLRIPLLTTFHGRDATIHAKTLTSMTNHGSRTYPRRRLVLAEKGDLFIAVSQFMKEKMIEIGIPEHKIVVHYTGIDVEIFNPDRSIRREPVALFVGRLDEMKGCDFAISAIAAVQSRMPDLRFVIIGDGLLRNHLERMAAGELRHFSFLGIQPPEVVRHWMNRASIFVAPSITARDGETETFGMVFAEAQAMELPVASFVSGGIPEAVVHGETGLLAKERDWKAVAHNIELLLREKEMRLRMGQAGRRRVSSLFDIRKQTLTLEAIYQQMTQMQWSKGSYTEPYWKVSVRSSREFD